MRAKELDPDLPGIDESLREAQPTPAARETPRDAERLLAAGATTKAEILANVVLYVAKDATAAERALAHSVLGRVQEKRERWDQAQRSFEEALRPQPDLAAAVDGLKRIRDRVKRD